MIRLKLKVKMGKMALLVSRLKMIRLLKFQLCILDIKVFRDILERQKFQYLDPYEYDHQPQNLVDPKDYYL